MEELHNKKVAELESRLSETSADLAVTEAALKATEVESELQGEEAARTIEELRVRADRFRVSHLSALDQTPASKDSANSRVRSLEQQLTIRERQLKALQIQVEALQTTRRTQALASNKQLSLEQCNIATRRVVAEQGINFVTNSADLVEDAEKVLDGVAGIALACLTDSVRVEIGGHTDDRGSKEVNQRISYERAISVRNALVERGVAGDRIYSKGFGDSKPLASNESEEGRKINRRISFEWIAKGTSE
jgi:outer membrane protein OmpA-like peptidoglycan-associated protein